MQVQQLLRLLLHPNKLLLQDLTMLEVLVKKYPYFYLAHALLAKLSYKQAGDAEKQVVQKAAIYAIDRSYLRAWLEGKLPLPPLRSPGVKADPEAEVYTGNDYLKAIVKKSVKKGSNVRTSQQFSVIDTFLNKNLPFDPFVENVVDDGETFEDLTQQGNVLTDRFTTETLATIMVQQKKYPCAIAIYERLMLKYPEKKAYFSDMVIQLKNKR